MRKSFGILPAGLLLFAATACQSALSQEKVKVQRVSHPPEPYTAEFKTTRVRTLANGTTITRETSTVEARDTQGRQLFADTSTRQYDNVAITHTNVEDPVAGTRTEWDSDKKRATVIKLPPQEDRHGCWSADGGLYTIHYGGSGRSPEAPSLDSIPKPLIEDLGTTMIQGVEAHGRRSTLEIPVGKIGNDQPLTQTTENWNAIGLGQLNLRRLADSPQNGKVDKELVSITRGEPDAALFQPPDGYEVVNADMVPCKE